MAKSQWTPPPIDVGLFFWNTDLTEAERTKITAWYRGLDPIARGYVDTLRSEQRDETQFESDYDG